MSIVHKIIPTKPFSFNTLNQNLSIENLVIDPKNETLNYYYVKGKSARGFDVSIDDGYIEIRNTTLSNQADYEITNTIASLIIEMFGGNLYNEDDDSLEIEILYSKDRILDLMLNDARIINILSREKEEIEIFCPIRNVFFGSNTYKKFGHLEGEDLKNEVYNLIQKVQYQLPDYPAGNIMRMGTDENPKILKLITRETDYIISKYDNIIFYLGDNQLLMIDNKILVSIIPKSWQLIDNLIIVAPRLDEKEWGKLIEDATPFNMYDGFNKKA